MQDYYEYMLSYSPVDNIEKKPYPNMLVTAGLHDARYVVCQESRPWFFRRKYTHLIASLLGK